MEIAMIDSSDQNHKTNVYRVLNSEQLKEGLLFALGKPRKVDEGYEYAVYEVEPDDDQYRVVKKIATYVVGDDKHEMYDDLSQTKNTKAFESIGEPQLLTEAKPKGKKEKKKGHLVDELMEENTLEVVAIPGKGDCFFQAVAYAALDDASFLKTASQQSKTWGKLEIPKGDDPMKRSKLVGKVFRDLVSKNISEDVYVTSRERAFIALNRAAYVKQHDKLKEKSEKKGSIYQEKDAFYLRTEEGDVELRGKPFVTQWEEGKHKEWIKAAASDVSEKQKLDDVYGGDTKYYESVLKLDTFESFKEFILSSDYWADENAMLILRKKLGINFIIFDRVLDICEPVGKFNVDQYSAFLEKNGAHFNIITGGENKFMWRKSDIAMQRVISKFQKGGAQVGGGDDDPIKEEVDATPTSPTSASSAPESTPPPTPTPESPESTPPASPTPDSSATTPAPVSPAPVSPAPVSPAPASPAPASPAPASPVPDSSAPVPETAPAPPPAAKATSLTDTNASKAGGKKTRKDRKVRTTTRKILADINAPTF